MANSCIGEGLLRALYRPFAMRDISFDPQRYKIPTINYYNVVLISGVTHYNSISKISSGVIRESFFLSRSVDVAFSLSLSR